MTVLKPGDLVVLKSGGPAMTVDAVNTDIFDDNKVTGVLCAWFVGNKLERVRFDYTGNNRVMRRDSMRNNPIEISTMMMTSAAISAVRKSPI